MDAVEMVAAIKKAGVTRGQQNPAQVARTRGQTGHNKSQVLASVAKQTPPVNHSFN